MYSEILSDQECAEIITKKCGSCDFQIVDKQIGPLSANTNGFLGIHLRATFNIILHGTPTTVQFFVKQQSLDPAHLMNQLTSETRAYAREAFFYQELIGAGKLVPWAPTFYLFKDDAMVLDDASTDGFTLPHFKANEIDLEHCKVILKAIAAFHANSFRLEEEKSQQLGRPYRLDEDHSDILAASFYHNKPNSLATDLMQQGVQTVENLVDIMPENPSVPREQFKKKFKSLLLQMYEQLQPSRRYRNAICHGDLWSKNLLIKYIDGKPDQCLLIDFQTVAYSVPATDVIMFIHYNASLAFVKTHLDELLQFYHTQLTDELNTWGINVQEILPWTEFMETVGEIEKVALILPTIYKTMTILDDEFYTGITNDAEKYRNFVFVNRSQYILKEYHNNSIYRAKITQIMNDLREELMQRN